MLANTELELESTRGNHPETLGELFLTFNVMALQGFGGLLAVAQRLLCEEKGWITKAHYIELLSIGQIVPGPPVVNVALMIGNRFFGWRGAAVALAGLLAVPMAIVLALTVVYAEFATLPAVAGALRGMGAASAGLIVGTALKLVQQLRRSPLGGPACLALGTATFVLVALVRLPLVWALLALGVAALTYATHRLRRDDAEGSRS